RGSTPRKRPPTRRVLRQIMGSGEVGNLQGSPVTGRAGLGGAIRSCDGAERRLTARRPPARGGSARGRHHLGLLAALGRLAGVVGAALVRRRALLALRL